MKLVRIVECKKCGHNAEILEHGVVCVNSDCSKNELSRDEMNEVQ